MADSSGYMGASCPTAPIRGQRTPPESESPADSNTQSSSEAPVESFGEFFSALLTIPTESPVVASLQELDLEEYDATTLEALVCLNSWLSDDIGKNGDSH
ncbi:hypothetical protein glysoja_018578 [Glycine soja]|nr:hypothetical protein glysoja_018578 [Glycine soja]